MLVGTAVLWEEFQTTLPVRGATKPGIQRIRIKGEVEHVVRIILFAVDDYPVAPAVRDKCNKGRRDGLQVLEIPARVRGHTTALPLPSRYMVRTIQCTKSARVM